MIITLCFGIALFSQLWLFSFSFSSFFRWGPTAECTLNKKKLARRKNHPKNTSQEISHRLRFAQRWKERKNESNFFLIIIELNRTAKHFRPRDHGERILNVNYDQVEYHTYKHSGDRDMFTLWTAKIKKKRANLQFSGSLHRVYAFTCTCDKSSYDCDSSCWW